MIDIHTEKRIAGFFFWAIAGIALLVLLTSCAPDPRKEAQAYQIRRQADQDALNQAQQRAHSEELHKLQLEQLTMDQEDRQALQQQWQLAANRAIWLGSLTIILAVCFSIIIMTRTTLRAIEGISAAVIRRADVAAHLIRLDKSTRQFPLLIQHVHGDKYALHNPNTGSVIMLDTANPADRQLIATAGVTQLAGVIAQEASKSEDPAGVAIIRPPIVDVEDGPLFVGKRSSENDR